MGALLDHFAECGVRFDRIDDEHVRARGKLTDQLRAEIRAHKPAILAELKAANESAHFRWSVSRPGEWAMEVRFSPEATLEQVSALYPGADCFPLRASDGQYDAAEPS